MFRFGRKRQVPEGPKPVFASGCGGRKGGAVSEVGSSIRVGGLRVRAAVTPGANSACIDVNEFRARVVADPAPPESKGRIAQSQGVDTGNANVDGVSLHVLAVLCHPRRTSSKELVAPGSSVAANDVNLAIGMTNGGSQIGKNVKDVRVVMLHVPGTMIAKKMIELRFGLRKIVVSPTIDDVDALARVRVV